MSRRFPWAFWAVPLAVVCVLLSGCSTPSRPEPAPVEPHSRPVVEAAPEPVPAITPEMLSQFHGAVSEGSLDDVTRMLGQAPKLVDTRDSVGGTALITAAYLDDLNLARTLIEHGAEVNARKTTDSWSALHFAAFKKSLPMAGLLLHSGADPNVARPDGGTPLHTAVDTRQLAMVEVLVKHGADVNAAKQDGWTPLSFAKFRKAEEIETFLREHGATNEGPTAGGE